MAKLRTLKAWNKRGRRVTRGEKASGWKERKDGTRVALFTKEQTHVIGHFAGFSTSAARWGWDSALDHNDGMDDHLWFDYH